MDSQGKQLHFSFARPTVRLPLKRASGTLFSTSSSPTVEAPANRLSFCEEDLVDFDPLEFSADVQVQPHLRTLSQCGEEFTAFDTSLPYNKAQLVSRWRRLTVRLSRTLQQQAKGTTTYLAADQPPGSALVSLSTSRPCSDATLTSSTAVHSFGGLSRSHTKRSSKTTIESAERSSILYDSDPFRVDPVDQTVHTCPPSKPLIGLLVEEGQVVDPNEIVPSPPSSCITTPASITPSSAISSANNPLRKSIRRLKTFTRNKLTSTSKPAAEPKASPVGPRGPAATVIASSVPPPCLPELSFDSTPLSVLVPPEQHSPDTAASHHERHEDTSLAKPLAPSQETRPAQASLPLIKWEFVDPKDLTPSPYSLASIDFPPPDSPSPAPSPSWLSRNVRDIEPRHIFDASQDQPPSPEPLPILPRSLLPVVSRRTSLELDIPDRVVVDRCPTPPRTPVLENSLALTSPGFLSVPSPRSSSVNHLSVLRYSRSISERKSIRSVLSVALSPDQESGTIVADEEPSKPRFLLLLHPLQSPSPRKYELTPNPSPLSLKLPVSFLRNSVPPTPVEAQEIYYPSKQAFAESVDTFPLPDNLRTVIKNISRSALNTPVMSADGLGKPMDTVDWGEEYDYSGYEWFKDPPPPRSEPAPPPPPEEAYAPPQSVVEQNEQFDFALKSAPNVLFGRYKQYGQLGVLAWCSEFGELTDDLKRLGFEGNMFVSTRIQALRTCEEILKLNLDIKMQIIVMYLSSQVARLRRFLDTETQFDDYPKTDFPLDYTQYSS